MAVAFGNDGSLFVADWENTRIERFDPSLAPIDAWPTDVRPFGVAVDRLGRVYVPDPGRTRVRVFSPTGTEMGELGGPGVPIDVSEPRQVATAPPGSPSVYVLGGDGVVRIDLQDVAPPPPAQGADGRSLVIVIVGVVLVGLAAVVFARRRRRSPSVQVAPLDRPVGLGAKDGAQR
jgi:LPXTG-motif cell wall-anchored protein